MPNPGPIQGVSASKTAFVGLVERGAVDASSALTSFVEFEAAYGGAPSLEVSGVTVPNYMALAAWAFFENGGQQLYVSRVAAEDGSNNLVPTAADYRNALGAIEGVKGISIVAAPGSSAALPTHRDEAAMGGVAAILAELIAHVSQSRYRFAVLDAPRGFSLTDVEALRGGIDSRDAALYYPWVTMANLLAGKSGEQISVPPSGFICGIYARSDAQQGVFKASTNQPVMAAVGLERAISDDEAKTLNGLGINCLRSFHERGILVWGARTVSSDQEWKYVNVRRYVAYLGHSVDQGTQWVVFEPNGPPLWAAIKSAIENFLMTEWRHGGLLGIKATDAFFVRCDETTMTQTDIDNGQVNCVVGVAVLRPAEFVIFRIGWKSTANTHN